MENTNYKVGDVVWFNNSKKHFSSCFISSSKIVKMTPGGKITLENGKEFKNGCEVKTKTCSYPTATIISEERAKKEFKYTEDEYRKSKLIQEALSAISGQRCGNGNYSISEEQEKALEIFIASFQSK